MKNGKLSLRDAANRYGMNFMTLCRYINKKRKLNPDNVQLTEGYAKPSMALTKGYYGMITKDLRKFAFELALKIEMATVNLFFDNLDKPYDKYRV